MTILFCLLHYFRVSCTNITNTMNRIINSWIPFANQIKYTSLVPMSKADGQFRHTVWDPFLIISQIVALQCSYYFTLGLWLSIICSIVGTSRSLDYIFRYQEIHVRNSAGILILIVFMFNALTSAIAMFLIVKRTKLCLDFSSTIYLFHLLICWFYNNQFPWNFSWWCLNLACLAVTCIFSEFLCMRSELKAIPLSMSQKMDL